MDGTVAVVVVELAQAAETDAAPRDANQVEVYSNKTDVRFFLARVVPTGAPVLFSA